MRVRAGDVIGRQADFWSLGPGASRVQSLQRVRQAPPPVGGGACSAFVRLRLGPQKL